jgi:hypothetical protein
VTASETPPAVAAVFCAAEMPLSDGALCRFLASECRAGEGIGLHSWDGRDAWTDEPTETKDAQMSDDTCRVYEVDGEPIRVHGQPMDAADQDAFAEIVRAAKRRFAREHPEPTDTNLKETR